MRAKLLQWWDALQSSYWFVPAVMAVGSILLSEATVRLDEYLDPDWISNAKWLGASKPEGARALLSTVAGAMITVAGVTFSVTIAAVAYTSSQFAPRILTNFMQNVGNQVTLGTFVATYLYCLLILRTVRSAGHVQEAQGSPDAAHAFVPHISLLVALSLALISVGVLIYFMHHVPQSIHVSNVIAGIGRELNAQILHRFPAQIGEPPDADSTDDLPPDFQTNSRLVVSRHNGYVQHFDAEDGMRAATRYDLIIQILAQPGDYVLVDQPLARVWPAERLTDEAMTSVRSSFALGDRRMPAQDSMFLVNELVEIAARALSPGVNDPMTAMGCMNWLKSALATVGRRQRPATRRYDEEGQIRVLAPTLRFDDFAEAGFQQLRPYAAADRNAAMAFLRCLQQLATVLDQQEHRDWLRKLASELRDDALQRLDFEPDRRRIELAYADFDAELARRGGTDGA